METQDFSGHRRRLRKRFLSQGLDYFVDYEALELLLAWIIPRKDVKSISKRLIRSYGNFRLSLDAPRGDLVKIEGIGENAATGIKFFREVIDQYLRERAFDEPLPKYFTLLKVYCQTSLSNIPIEVFYVVYLDAGRRVSSDSSILGL
jgi:DNA repair protein RadC